jgi:hypothetical protein
MFFYMMGPNKNFSALLECSRQMPHVISNHANLIPIIPAVAQVRVRGWAFFRKKLIPP